MTPKAEGTTGDLRTEIVVPADAPPENAICVGLRALLAQAGAIDDSQDPSVKPRNRWSRFSDRGFGAIYGALEAADRDASIDAAEKALQAELNDEYLRRFQPPYGPPRMS